MSTSLLADETRCKIALVFPFETENLNGVEVLSTIDGPVESLKIVEVENKFKNALKSLDIGIASRGEHIDFKIEVGFAGVYNKDGSVLPELYIKARDYERSIEARKSSGIIGTLLNDVSARAEGLFDSALDSFVAKLDKCNM